MKCAECGKAIKNPHFINGIAYGYNCYRQKIALIYKQWEDERNVDYSVKCFAAIEVFKNKKTNSFHESIIKQWNDCKKLTAKQLECIIKGFCDSEKLSFYKVWFLLAYGNNKNSIASWMEILIRKIGVSHFVDDEEVHKILLCIYPQGIHFWRDVEDMETDVHFTENGKYTGRNRETKERFYDSCFLDANIEDEYIEVLAIIK